MRERSWRENPYCLNFSRRSERTRVFVFRPSERDCMQMKTASALRNYRLSVSGPAAAGPADDGSAVGSASVCRPHHHITSEIYMHVARSPD